MSDRPEERLTREVPGIQSSHAILLLSDNYVLQLRDDKANIAAPGQWSLFGGLMKNGERPLHAIRREIFEELGILPSKFDYLWLIDYVADFERRLIRSWFFVSNVSAVWADHKLMEGQDLGIFRFEQIAGLSMPAVMHQTIERFQDLVKEISWKPGQLS